jgi:hypothetical protein
MGENSGMSHKKDKNKRYLAMALILALATAGFSGPVPTPQTVHSVNAIYRSAGAVGQGVLTTRLSVTPAPGGASVRGSGASNGSLHGTVPPGGGLSSTVLAAYGVAGRSIPAAAGKIVAEAQAGQSLQVAPDGDVTVSILTSGGEGDTNAWKAIDGQMDTAWVGMPAAGGCWFLISCEPGIVVSNVAAHFTENSSTNVMLMGAVDAKEWQTYPVGTPFEKPVVLNHLWFIFPADAIGGITSVDELTVNESADGE